MENNSIITITDTDMQLSINNVKIIIKYREFVLIRVAFSIHCSAVNKHAQKTSYTYTVVAYPGSVCFK